MMGRLARPPFLHRQRLSQALVGRAAVWICGAAGTGKTTVVHGHFGAAGASAKTHHLERTDRDPVRLFERIASLYPELKHTMVDYPGPQFADEVVFARHFWSKFWAFVPASTAIVLEDHHELGGDANLDSILREGMVAVRAEQGQQLIVTSRDDVPPRLAELVTLGVLSVIDDAALRFTRAEAKALTVTSLGRTAGARADALYELSAGWAACHVRLLEHLRLGGELPEPLHGDGPQALYDYLAAEVIAALAPAERSALLAASLFRSASPRLVATLAEDAAAGDAMAKLLALGLIGESEAGSPVTVHPLLAAACQRFGARELGSERFRQLTRRAAELLAADGNYDEAIQVSLQHGAVERAVHWVKMRAFSVLASGRVATLARWLGELPREAIATDPRLSFWLTHLTVFGPPRAAAQGAAYHALVQSEDWLGAYVAWTVVADELTIGVEAERCARWLDELDVLAARAPHPNDAELQAQFRRTLRCAHVCAGRERLTLEVARELVGALTEGTTNGLAVAMLMWKLHFYAGPAAAAALHVDAKRLLSGRPNDPLASIASTLCDMLVSLAQGRHREAIERGLSALELPRQLGLRMIELQIWTGIVTGTLVADDLESLSKYEASLAAAPSHDTNVEEGFRHYTLAACAMRRGKWKAAQYHSDICRRRGLALGAPEFTVYPDALEAELLQVSGETSTAESLLDELIELCRVQALDGCWPSVLMISSWLALRAGHLERALLHAEQGLVAAQATGGLVPFQHLTKPRLAEVCALALQHGIANSAARWLITALELDAPSRVIGVDWPWRFVVRALGGLSLSRDHAELEAPTGKAGELFWLLVALGGRDVPVHALCDRLWPDADGDAARRAFDTTLHRLRQSAPFQDLLTLSNGRLGLSRKSVWIDVDVVRQLASGGHGAEPAAAVSALWQAYRGELFCDLASFAWSMALAEEVRGKAQRAVMTLADSLEHAGQRDASERLYERARAFALVPARRPEGSVRGL